MRTQKQLKWLLLLGSFCFHFAAWSQERTVTGKVSDAKDGSALPGVAILLKGAAKGTVTDAQGNFSLSVPETGSTLIFNMMGMKSETVEVGAQTIINVLLIEDVKEVQEVYAIGYGYQEKIYNSGSISTVKGKDIANLPVTSFEQGLQGRLAGVQVSSPSGELGAAMRMRIRGSASVTASNQPLFVIDGFIVTADDPGNFTDNNINNPLADLNPNDIESVEVLKDAAAAAIYGARGANGVVLISTKRGQKGKTKFNLNVSTGFSNPTHLRKFLNREEYINMFTAAATNSDGYDSTDAGLNQAWSDYSGNPASGPNSFSDLRDRNINTNWNKEAYRRAIISQYDFSAAGGNEKTRFLISLGLLNQEGIIFNNKMNRFSGRINLDHTVNDKIKLGLSVNQVYTRRNNVPENNQFNSPLQANALAPILPLFDRTGEYNDSTYYANPFRAMTNNRDYTTNLRNFSNVYASWEIIKGLTLRSEVGLDLLNYYEYGWQGSKFPASAGTPSSGKYGTSRVINYSTNNTLTYTKTLDEKHNFQALLGQSFQYSESENSFMQAQGIPLDDFKYLANASQNTSFNSDWSGFAFTSYFGRLNYNYDGKYLFSASLREDGSSRFGKSQRYGFFPAASAGWILTQEDFIKNLDISETVSLVKFKTSFGQTGNSEIADFASRGIYNTSFFGNRGGIFPRQLANSDLSWEKTLQWDAGIEFGFWKNRITGGVDYYQKKTNDLLLSVPIPSTSGFSSALRNVGKMENKGWDIYLNTRNVDGDFKWNTSFNISFFENKVTNLVGQKILPTTSRVLNSAIEGQPLGVFYGVEWAGVDPKNGDALYKSGDTTTNSWTTANKASNLRILGNPNPKHFGGINNSFEFMGFDLSIFFQWSYGNKIHNSSSIFQASGFTNFSLDNQSSELLDYWKKEGDVTLSPRPQLDANNGGRTTSRFLYDGSYLRLKTITFGYSLPKNLLEHIKLSTVRFYATAQNLMTWTNYIGNDPEVNYFAPNATTQNQNLATGVDYYSAAQAKTIIFGVNIGF